MARFTQVFLFLLMAGIASGAQTFYVSGSGSDDGTGLSPENAFRTVDRAVGEATDGDTISLLPGAYEIGVPLEFELSIIGEGTGSPTLSGRLVTMGNAVVHIGGVKLSDGVENHGEMTMTHCEISGSLRDEAGAGIANHGTMTFSEGLIRGNRTEDGLVGDYAVPVPRSALDAQDGGGIFNAGTFVLRDTLVVDNHAGAAGSGSLSEFDAGRSWPGTVGDGGGIFNAADGTMTVDRCTFIGNTAGNSSRSYYEVPQGGHGGAIYNAGQLQLSACLFHQNLGGISREGGSCNCGQFFPGRGTALYSLGNAELTNSTFVGGTYLFQDPIGRDWHSRSADTVFVSDGSTRLLHCTSKARIPAQDGLELGYCLAIGSGDLPDHGIGPNLVVDESELGELGEHSGSIPGFALLPGSAAIDAGAPGGEFPELDQRGVQRVIGSRIDIGALEFNDPQTYAEWAADRLPPGEKTGPLDDWDGDCRSNLDEFADGTDPAVPDGGKVVASGSAECLSIQFQRNLRATGLQYAVEVSGDLQNWIEIYRLSDSPATMTIADMEQAVQADSIIGMAHSANPNEAGIEVVVKEPVASADERRFIRLVRSLSE